MVTSVSHILRHRPVIIRRPTDSCAFRDQASRCYSSRHSLGSKAALLFVFPPSSVLLDPGVTVLHAIFLLSPMSRIPVYEFGWVRLRLPSYPRPAVFGAVAGRF